MALPKRVSLCIALIAVGASAVNVNVSVTVNHPPPPGGDECWSEFVAVDTDIHPAEYPVVYRNESVVESFFGGRYNIPDPYRSLEDADSASTKQFIAQLNNLSRPFLDRAPDRELFHQTIVAQMESRQSGVDPCVTRHGHFYYYWDNPGGGRNQAILYRRMWSAEKKGVEWRKGVEDDGEVFLDPNDFSKHETSGVREVSFNWDGSIAAYIVTETANVDVGVIKVRHWFMERVGDCN